MPKFKVEYVVHVHGVVEVEAKTQEDAHVLVAHDTAHADLVADGDIGEGHVDTLRIEEVED